MTISNWPLAERPTEKLFAYGAKNLSDAELIAIFLRTGVRGKTALDIARDLLNQDGGLKKVLSTPVEHILAQYAGIGRTKIAMLKAAIELGKRYMDETIRIGEKMCDPMATKRYLKRQLHDHPHEVFACVFLNNQNEVLCFEELFHGTLTEANVYPREVVKRSLQHNAAKIILAHNHPSGNPLPSQADRDVTQLLVDALALIDVQVIDHIIVGAKENTSFAEMGLI